MTEQQAREVFERIAAVHAARDAGRLATAFTDDAVLQDDGADHVVRGLAELAAFYQAVWRAFSDFAVEIVEGPFVADGGFAVRGRITGTMDGPLDPPGFAPTHTRLDVEFGGFYACAGARVRHARVVMDTTAVAQQLGALPAPGSLGERAGTRLQHLQALRLRRRG